MPIRIAPGEGAGLRATARCAFICLLLACCAWLPVARAASSSPTIGPPPRWIERHAVELPVDLPPDQVSQGVHYLLIDTQIRVDGAERTVYRHTASKAVNEHGVEQAANVEIAFDPSYQTLVLHAINVRRGDIVIPKLSLSAIKVLQRERELEALIFDGGRTANLFLDDVRVGDVVETEYSLRGSNAIFGGRAFGQQYLQWSVPVDRLELRLLWPAHRELLIENRNWVVRPDMVEHDGVRDYRWHGRKVDALFVESDAPAWFDPYPLVRWSEYRDWHALASWAVPLYEIVPKAGPAIRAEVERIAASSQDPAERLLAVLHFVQAQIRYLGVEVGAGAHAPSSPELVLRRRFGDCKDKARLMVAMLKVLGIEADVALVNTRTGRGIAQLQPGPDLFNHAIVHVRMGDRDHWLDATRLPQVGNLDTVYQPDFGHALLVRPDTTELTPMAQRHPAPNLRRIHAVIDSRAGIGQPARMTVDTVYEGASAEWVRGTLAGASAAERQKRYLNFYARYYAGASVDAPMAIEEDAVHNRLTTTEHYVLPELWKAEPASRRQVAAISVPDIEGFLYSPSKPVRTSPLALDHPLDIEQTTEVLLPETFSLKADVTEVSDPAFSFERKVTSVAGTKVTIKDHFRSLADHVDSTDVARYAANIELARNALGYSLYKRAALPSASPWQQMNWPMVLVAVLVLALAIWASVRIHGYDPVPRPAVDAIHLRGIQGWLVILALVMVTWPMRLVWDLREIIPSYSAQTWADLTTSGAEHYDPMWAPTLLFELIANIVQVVFVFLTAVLFFRKRSSAPRILIAVFWGSLAAQVLDLLLSRQLPQAVHAQWRELVRAAIGSGLWTAYLLRSRRVRATFVERRSASAAAALSPSIEVPA